MTDKTDTRRIFGAKVIIGVLAALVLVIGVLAAFVLPERTTPILMYHSISGFGNASTTVSPENFKKQMEFLYYHDYRVISLESLVAEIKKGHRYLPKVVVITFDDGYEDNFTNAFPVLAKYNMPATIFIITGFVGTDNAALEWDPDRQFNVRKRYLTWEQVSLMHRNGLTFGAHSREHAYLPSITDDKKLLQEILGPKADIKLKVGLDAEFFCYPLGGFTEKVKKAVKGAGYTAAFTTNRGYDRTNADLYELKRIKVTNSDMNSPLHFRAKLSGFYNLFRSSKKGS
ncbi:MAG: polysaccharide deacetylase family protein [Candidatus Omnitrophica bacterium]|nr:polysaccharide deacetylase family protein [Candidatus Omnitrophota bacterium]